MNIFDTNFVFAIKSEIAKQLAADNGPVTRKTVLATMSLGLDSEGMKDAELAVSLAFRLGLVPEYKMFQKIGIKPAEYVPASKKKKEEKPEPKQRKLNPKVQARVDAKAAAEAEAADDATPETEESSEE